MIRRNQSLLQMPRLEAFRPLRQSANVSRLANPEPLTNPVVGKSKLKSILGTEVVANYLSQTQTPLGTDLEPSRILALPCAMEMTRPILGKQNEIKSSQDRNCFNCFVQH
jgi:hypothetical protein